MKTTVTVGAVVIMVFVRVTLALVDPHVRFNGGPKINAWFSLSTMSSYGRLHFIRQIYNLGS